MTFMIRLKFDDSASLPDMDTTAKKAICLAISE